MESKIEIIYYATSIGFTIASSVMIIITLMENSKMKKNSIMSKRNEFFDLTFGMLVYSELPNILEKYNEIDILAELLIKLELFYKEEELETVKLFIRDLDDLLITNDSKVVDSELLSTTQNLMSELLSIRDLPINKEKEEKSN